MKNAIAVLERKRLGKRRGRRNCRDRFWLQNEEKTWEIIRELAPDMSVFDVLSYSKEFHNLKAAIKEA